jgi:ribosomal protein S27E
MNCRLRTKIDNTIISIRRIGINMPTSAFWSTDKKDRCMDCMDTDILHVPPTAPYCLRCGNYVTDSTLFEGL